MTTYQLFQKLIISFGITLLTLYIGSCVFLLLRQRQMIFKPTYDIVETPSHYNLKYEEIWIFSNSKGNLQDKLHGWFIPSEKDNLEFRNYTLSPWIWHKY